MVFFVVSEHGKFWCHSHMNMSHCKKCSRNNTYYQLHYRTLYKQLLTVSLHTNNYSFHTRWDFLLTLPKTKNSTRLFGSLMTLNKKYVDVIALKFLIEYSTEDNLGGYAFMTHFQLPYSRMSNSFPELAEFAERSTWEIESVMPHEWTFLQAIDKLFFFRVEHGPIKNIFRSGTCAECSRPIFGDPVGLDYGFAPAESKKQIFYLYHNDDCHSETVVNFTLHCFLVDLQRQYVCPSADQSNITDCRIAVRVKQKKDPWNASS